MTAEANQLVAREGPLWDEMIKNVQLPIIEGAATMARENAESVRRAMQRGGSARRDAFAAVQGMRAQERINSQRGQALSQARMNMDVWARDNARTQLEFNANWTANLGGIRENYNQAMDKAAELMSTSALPQMMMAKEKAAEWRYKAHAKNRARTSRWISGAISLVAMGIGGLGTMASAGLPGSGMLGAIGGAVGPKAGAQLIQGGLRAGASAIGQQSLLTGTSTPTYQLKQV
jgi:hypothetical protein